MSSQTPKPTIGTAAVSRAMLVALALLCAAVGVGAQPDSVVQQRDYRFRIEVAYHYKSVAGPLAEHFGPAHAGGLYLSLPTGLPSLDITLGADAGLLQSKSATVPDLTMFELDFLLSYSWRPGQRWFGIEACAGLTSSLVFLTEGVTLNKDVLIASESEFGLRVGIRPYAALGRYRVGIPLSVAAVLSAPDMFMHLDVGCSVSREF